MCRGGRVEAVLGFRERLISRKTQRTLSQYYVRCAVLAPHRGGTVYLICALLSLVSTENAQRQRFMSAASRRLLHAAGPLIC